MEERENIDTWQGIPEERFRRYKSWVTPSGYLCGTYAATVFLAYFDLPYRGRATVFGGWQRACKRIDQGKPVIVGLLKPLGSTYGNHWVVAYAYLETETGRYLKVHDNWGNYNQVIPASWINGTVSLP